MILSCQTLRSDSRVVRTLAPGYTGLVQLKDWVKAERERRGWTQQQLADAAGLNRVEANALETGRNKGSTLRIRVALARAFGIHVDEVGGGVRPVSAATDDASARPVFGRLPGWREAEAEARELLPGKPEWVWEGAREVSGVNCPPVADVALVLKAVALVKDYPPQTPGDSAETTAAKAAVAAERAKAERRIARKDRGG